jgi:ribonuclease R
MYRVHEAPGREKLAALKDYLATFDLEFALGQVIRPATFNRILARVEESDSRPEIMEQVLRTQTQARYSPDPLGHFGLACRSYAHFTSPIRRYADLLVHRALVSHYRLAKADCRRKTPRASPRSASTSPCSNGERWKPSGRRSTATSRPILPIMSANCSIAVSRGSNRSAFSPR